MISCVVVVIFIVIGILYFHYETEHIQNDKYDDLYAITVLKSDAIQGWRKQRLVDIRLINHIVMDFLQDATNPTTTKLRTQLKNDLSDIYADALVLDINNTILLSMSPNPAPISDITQTAITVAIANRTAVLGDFFCHQDRIYIDVVMPITDSDRFIAMMVLRSDATKFLYPFIQTWPVSSKTAETLLVRRDGDSILFLNELRHKSDAALRMRIPLSDTHIAGVQAVLNNTDTPSHCSGIDYRGVEVLATSQAIPQSSWHIVAKVDRDEILVELRYRTWAITIVIVLLILVSVGLPTLYIRLRLEIEHKYAADNLRVGLEHLNKELERSNKELEQFASVASHDLQEPLRLVASYTQLLAERYEGKLDEKAQQYIAYAVEGATRMQRLVNDLLMYSRINTRANLSEITDSRAILDVAINNLSIMVEESKSIIVIDGEFPKICVDALQFVQVFQNLIANAIKFHGDDTPRVYISVQDMGREWVFSIRDNGIGIDKKYEERIFVIFQRLHTRQAYPGTGIGLAVCRRIVELHGGRIWFESELGKGSTFFFAVLK